MSTMEDSRRNIVIVLFDNGDHNECLTEPCLHTECGGEGLSFMKSGN